MSTRWLAGTLLFTLGFGSALLVRLPEADAASTEGVVEGRLKYIDGADFRLVYPVGGKTDYLVVVSRPPGANDSGPEVSYKSGLVTFSKKDLENVTVYQVKPLIMWKAGAKKSGAQKSGAEKSSIRASSIFRCGEGPFLCPLPPTPPPIGYRYVVFKSATSAPGRSR